MEDLWPRALFTAILLAPPSILGMRALLRGPTRFAGRVVPRRMNWVIAAIWLAAFPLTVGIVFARIYLVPPRSSEEADYLGNDWGPAVLRMISVLCLITGGAIALMTARPEEVPKDKGKPKKKKKRK